MKIPKIQPIIVDSVKKLEETLLKIVLDRQTNEIELKKMLGKLTMEVIVICAFGTRIDVYNEGKSLPYIENTNEMIAPSLFRTVIFILFSLSSRFAHFITKTIGSPVFEFFRSAVSLILRN